MARATAIVTQEILKHLAKVIEQSVCPVCGAKKKLQDVSLKTGNSLKER
jgi:hypothetical protein